jgi:type II secretory pathway pseudopilin PulG
MFPFLLGRLFFSSSSVEMSTKNYDSSNLTQRRQAKALGAFAAALQAQIETAEGQFTVRRTQPTDQRAIIKTEQNLGVCYCAKDREANPYGFNPSGGPCGCGMGSS